MPNKLILVLMPLLLSASLLLGGCGSSNERTVNNTAVRKQADDTGNVNGSTVKKVEVRSDIEGLEKQIKLPVRPKEVLWAAEVFDNSKGLVPGPSDYQLTAVLKYDEKSAAELLQKIKPVSEKNIGNSEIKTWFPEEIKKEAKTLDGRSFLQGINFTPDLFFRPPHSNGGLIRVGKTNYFVLNLFSS